MRILHLADLHLGWQPEYLGERKEERRKERDSLLARATEFALDKRNAVDAVLIAGDLFETHRPAPALAEYAIQRLQELESAGLFLLTVPGNHDEITYHDSVFRREAARWPGVLAKNPMPDVLARFEKDGKTAAFYGLAYTGGITRTSPPLSHFPKVAADYHVGVLHGSLGWDTGDRSLPIDTGAVAQSGYDCLALGHLHSHSVRVLGKTTACYAGAAEAKTFSDPGTGMFTILTLEDQVRAEQFAAGCRPCVSCFIDLRTCDGLHDVEREIKKMADSNAICRVILKGGAGFHADAAELSVRFSHLFYYLRVENDGYSYPEGLIEQLAAEPTIRGYFVKNLLEKISLSQDDSEKEVLRRALIRGIAALQGGGQ